MYLGQSAKQVVIESVHKRTGVYLVYQQFEKRNVYSSEFK